MQSSRIFRSAARHFSSSAARQQHVAVLGAAGGIGQPLSLLLKNNPLVTKLSLFDISPATAGVAADLAHISSPAAVSGHSGTDNIGAALKGAKVVVIPAGVPRKPGMTRDDLFNTNAGIVKNLAEACAEHCPDAHLLIIANPVNSTVPIVAEVLKKKGTYNPARLFGVTTLDVTRAKTFVSEAKGADVESINIPVVGGHAGITILPLLSQNTAGLTFTDAERDELTHRIQFGGDEVVKAKDGAGSATLSMAYAGAHFTFQLIRALNGEKGIVEPAFVQSTVTELPFFASPIELGEDGVKEIHDCGNMTDYEQQKLETLIQELGGSIKKGVDFVNNA